MKITAKVNSKSTKYIPKSGDICVHEPTGDILIVSYTINANDLPVRLVATMLVPACSSDVELPRIRSTGYVATYDCAQILPFYGEINITSSWQEN